MNASPQILAGLLPVERLLFASDLLCAGTFRCQPGHVVFKGGLPSTAHCIAFPRTAVWIQHEGGRRFVADPSVATLYNRNDTYWRWQISPEGDHSDWLAFPPDVILEAAATIERSAVERLSPDKPFNLRSVPLAARIYAAQRSLFNALEQGVGLDSLAVEEAGLYLLEVMVRQGQRALNGGVAATSPKAIDALEHVRALLAGEPALPVSLRELATQVGWSPSHLCREFRRYRGMTITEYRAQLRLRFSLERIRSTESLVDLALELGFSSHSHFTSAFRRLFGSVPSQFRKRLRDARNAGPATPSWEFLASESWRGNFERKPS